ncbi:RNA-directed DNA polymerase, eukaryota, reverse transcriptase zinc-binding domain protein [Tanacetum coccineum]|uniref:RNA-directed DNA polymerase, eukaryota, reverse transcriptase zinc-binding domain protein n=1 Tax=Tanacetum coccineum TaxID=301880 RepID=A0ABQ5FSW9_9ASTR
MMIFKVDFEKAYDSVRWDYLDDVLKKFGFKERWRGDSLSPFLFILVMESLHISVQGVVDAGMFKVANGIVDQTANEIGCKTLKAPFSYLGSKVIRGIHCDDGKLHKNINHSHPSIWLDIVREITTLKNQGLDLCSFIHKKMGNGSETSFWEDTWRGELDFKTAFPKIYALKSFKSITVADKMSNASLEDSFRQSPRSGIEQDQYLKLLASVESVVLINMQDRWIWSKEGSGEFSVASARRLIDDRRLPNVSTKTRWIKVVPIKVNVHAWKVKLDRLPTRLNISRRGMDIDSILCPSCGVAVESVSHVFFTVHIARELFHSIFNRWDINFMELSLYENWLEWLLNIRLSSKHKKMIEGICYIMWWSI